MSTQIHQLEEILKLEHLGQLKVPNLQDEIVLNQVVQIPVIHLTPNPENYRKTADEESIKELAQNIKNNGQLQPITARLVKVKLTSKDIRFETHGKFAYEFQIVFGHRRYQALNLLRLEAQEPEIIKASVILTDVTDKNQLADMMISENLQRQDVHPLEEAEYISQLLKSRRKKPKQIAMILGKSESFVRQRIKLIDLSQEWKFLFMDEGLTIDAALEIARCDKAGQKDIYEKYVTPQHGFAVSTKGLRHYIKESIFLRLDKASFDVTDEKLYPKAKACTTCPKNTAKEVTLFGKDFHKHDLCTDKKCFDKKAVLNAEQNSKAYFKIASDYKSPILLTGHYYDDLENKQWEEISKAMNYDVNYSKLEKIYKLSGYGNKYVLASEVPDAKNVKKGLIVHVNERDTLLPVKRFEIVDVVLKPKLKESKVKDKELSPQQMAKEKEKDTNNLAADFFEKVEELFVTHTVTVIEKDFKNEFADIAMKMYFLSIPNYVSENCEEDEVIADMIRVQPLYFDGFNYQSKKYDNYRWNKGKFKVIDEKLNDKDLKVRVEAGGDYAFMMHWTLRALEVKDYQALTKVFKSQLFSMLRDNMANSSYGSGYLLTAILTDKEGEELQKMKVRYEKKAFKETGVKDFTWNQNEEEKKEEESKEPEPKKRSKPKKVNK